MSISTAGGTEYIDFGSVAVIRNLGTITISAWIYLTNTNTGSIIFLDANTLASDEEWEFSITTGGKLQHYHNRSSIDPIWRSVSGLSTGQWYNVVMTYNNNSTSNDPVFYVNGSSVSISEIQAPSGTYVSGTNNSLSLCGQSGVDAFNGLISDVRVYGSILSASQVLALYNDGPFTPNYDTDLVFHAPLTKSTALSGSSFDGYTLTSSQKLVDRIGCAEGTPSGSPLGSDTNPT